MFEWIKYSVRKPEKSGTYLILSSNQSLYRIFTFDNEQDIAIYDSLFGIDYWLPIPEPPKSDEKAKKCLDAVRTVLDFLTNEKSYEQDEPSTKWTDKKGFFFETDMEYFYGGLEDFEKCLMKRLHQNNAEEE